MPTNVNASAISPRVIYITWSPPPFIDQNGIITEYSLTYRGVDRDFEEKSISILTANTRSTTSRTVSDLEEDTDYIITIRAHTIIGAGPISTVTVHTPESGK